jgi:hypothetical protein
LKRWGAPNPDDVIFVNSLEEKVEVLDNKICDFFVDDFTTGQENSIGTFRKEVALAIEAKGIHVIVFRNNWLDVLEQIEMYLEKEQ